MTTSGVPPPLVAVAVAAPSRAAAAPTLVPTALDASTTNPMMPSGPLQPALVRALDQTQKEQEEAAAAAADQLLSAAQRANGDDDDDNARINPTPASGLRAGDVAPISTAATATATAMTMTEALTDPPPGPRAPSPTPSSRSGGSGKKSKKKNKKSGGGGGASSALASSEASSASSSPRAAAVGSPKGKGPRRHSAAKDEDTFDWEATTTTAACAAAPNKKNTATTALAAAEAADPHLARAVRYAGVFLTPESRELLLACLPPTHTAFVRGDHVTLAYKPTACELGALLPSLGRTVEVRVTGEARSSKLQAAAVELYDPRGGLPPTTSSAALHCTLSFAAGSSAAEAGPMLHDAFLAAYDEVARERCQDASLRFTSLEEPLVLFGRVGVELEAFASSFDFSAAAAAAGPSTSSAAASSSDLGRKGDVIFSSEELARAAASACSQPVNKTLPAAPQPPAPAGRTSIASFYLNGHHHQNGGALVGGAGDDDDDDEDGAGGLSLVSSRAPPAAAQTTAAAAAPVAIPTTTTEPAPPPSPTTLLKQRYAALERAHGASVCRAVLQACRGNLRDTVAELEGARSPPSCSPPPVAKDDHEATDAALAREVARQLELQERGERAAQEAADAAHAAALAAEGNDHQATTAALAPPPPPPPMTTTAQTMLAPPPPTATDALNAVHSNNARRKAEVVRALATAAGADPSAAVALLDLDPLAAPAVVVSALVECNGQADAAADALLSGRPPRYTSEQLMMMRAGGSGGGGGSAAAAAAPLAPSSYAAAAVPPSAAALVRTLAAAHPAVPEAMLFNTLEASGGDLAVATRLLAENEAAGGWQRVRSSSGSPRHRRASSPGALSSMAAEAAAAAAMTSSTMFPPLGQAQGQHHHHRGGRPWHSSGSSAGGSSSSAASSERASPRGGLASASAALLHPPSSAPQNLQQQQQSLPRRPSSSSSSSSSSGGGGGNGNGNGNNLGRSPPGSRSPPRGARGQGYQQQPQAAAAIRAEVDRLYKEADMKQLEASVLERAAQQAPTKQDADRHLANRRAALERAAALRREAVRLAPDAHNTGKVNNMEVDVHGQSVAAALQCVRRMLESAGGLADASRADSRLKVIFGKGLHSGIEGPVLRPAVLDLLSRGGYEYEVPPYNPGVVFVTVRPGQAMGGAGPSSPLLL